METTIEKLDPTRVKLTLAISPEEFKPAMDEAYVHISRDIAVPGFRKGKVPPAIIDRRIGRAAVIDHAVNDHLDGFFRKALADNELTAIGRPSAEVVDIPDPKTLEGNLVVDVEVDVRPEIAIPDFSDVEVTVDPAEVTDADVDEELDRLRSSFGTLTTQDRPAKKGDFTSIDLTATVNGEQVDTASNVSYEIGSGQLLDGIDEALEDLSAGETTTFSSVLVGGDHEGETAEVTVTLNSVKERQLPEADDAFAQMASEYDTIAELRDSLRSEVARRKANDQLTQARERLGEALIEKADVPTPTHVVDDEVRRHLEQEGKPDDDPHGDEVREQTAKTLREQMLFDVIGEANDIKVSQDELTRFVIESAYRYGADPNEFMKSIAENRQVPALVAEVGRRKVLDFVLRQVAVKDSNGDVVDLSELLTPAEAAPSSVAADAAEEPASTE